MAEEKTQGPPKASGPLQGGKEQTRQRPSMVQHLIAGIIDAVQTLNVGSVSGQGLGDVNASGGLNLGTATGAGAADARLGCVSLDEQSRASIPASGRHLEAFWYPTGSEYLIEAYNRTAGAYLPINMSASQFKVSNGPLVIADGQALQWSDVNLYRGAANQLKTDDDFCLADGKKLLWSDVNLYRSAANMLKTDDGLTVAQGLNLGSATGAAAGQVKCQDLMVVGTVGNVTVGNTSGAWLMFDRPNAVYVAASNAAGYLNFCSGGTTPQMVLNAAGGLNVGVATGAPAGAAYIRPNNTGTEATILGLGSDSFGNPGTLVLNSSSGGAGYTKFQMANWSGAFYFQKGSAGGPVTVATIDLANSRLGVGVAPSEAIHSSAKVRANTVFNVNGTDGISVTDNPIVALQLDVNDTTGQSSLQYKTQSRTFVGGIRTATGAVSGWMDVPQYHHS